MTAPTPDLAPGAKAPAPVTRVVKFAIDEQALASCGKAHDRCGTECQVGTILRHEGTARAAWNWACARWHDWRRNVRDHVWRQARDEAMAALGLTSTDDLDAAQLVDLVVEARRLYYDKAWQDAAFTKARGVHGANNVFENEYALGQLFRLDALDPTSGHHWWETDRRAVNGNAMAAALTSFGRAVRAFYGRAKNGQPYLCPRTGRLLGAPRFKRLGDDQQGFQIFNVTETKSHPYRAIDNGHPDGRGSRKRKKTDQTHGGHRIVVPTIGSIRTKENNRRLRRLIAKGGRPTSAKFSRSGGNRYVTIYVTFAGDNPYVAAPSTTRRQRGGGIVGARPGIHHLATLSNGVRYASPGLDDRYDQQISELRRKLDRQHRAGSPDCYRPRRGHMPGHCLWGAKGPDGRPAGPPVSRSAQATRARIGKLRASLGVERRRIIHLMTKELVTSYEVIGIQKWDIESMVRRNPSKPDGNGGFERTGQKARTALARALLDSAPGEIRRQLEYKAPRYGSRLVVIDRLAPTGRSCSDCGTATATLSRSGRTLYCGTAECSNAPGIARDLNAALNVRKHTLEALTGTDSADEPSAQAHTGDGPPSAVPAGSKPHTRGGTTGRELPSALH